MPTTVQICLWLGSKMCSFTLFSDMMSEAFSIFANKNLMQNVPYNFW
jgi:hypothetical protein